MDGFERGLRYLPKLQAEADYANRLDKYRLSYERRGDISFIARETILYFVTSERSEQGTKYDIVMRAIKLVLPSLECDNLFIVHIVNNNADIRTHSE